MERRRLDNGLVALVESMPSEDDVQLCVGIKGGPINEPLGKEGVAHLFEHMMFGSSKGQTARQFAETIEFSGMDMNAATNLTDVYFDVLFPGAKLKLGVEAAFRAVTNRDFPFQEMLKEKSGPVWDELITSQRTPYKRFVDDILYPTIFKGTLLGRPVSGTPSSLESITNEDLLTFKDKYFIPNNMIISAAGAVNPSDFFREIEIFGQMSTGKPVEQPPVSLNWMPRVVFKEFPDFKDAGNPKLDAATVFVAYKVNPVTHPDDAGLSFLNTVLGSGMSSLLFQELREKRGIGYSPASSYISIRETGIMYLGVESLRPQRVEETVDAIFDVVNNIRLAPLEKRIFDGKKTQLLESYKRSCKDPIPLCYMLLSDEIEHPHCAVSELSDAIEALTPEALQDIAKRNFSGGPIIVIASAAGYQNRFIKEAVPD